MKKVVLCVCVFLIVTLANGQPSVALKGGINVSNVKGYYWYTKARLGYNAGFLARQQIGGRLFFQPELLFSSKL